jgi:glyoxylase-like metal-dependent hydrolase (beta-lactamase superfamily II)
VQAFWGLGDWPEGCAALDLGGRRLTVFPTPGHETAHIAAFDGFTGILLTGDVLYPGLLTVRDWPAFRATARRLRGFAVANRVRLVLGNHVEMSRTPGLLYPLGTTWQPDEHPLPLGSSDLEVIHRICEAMADAPHDVTEASFAIKLMPGAHE